MEIPSLKFYAILVKMAAPTSVGYCGGQVFRPMSRVCKYVSNVNRTSPRVISGNFWATRRMIPSVHHCSTKEPKPLVFSITQFHADGWSFMLCCWGGASSTNDMLLRNARQTEKSHSLSLRLHEDQEGASWLRSGRQANKGAYQRQSRVHHCHTK